MDRVIVETPYCVPLQRKPMRITMGTGGAKISSNAGGNTASGVTEMTKVEMPLALVYGQGCQRQIKGLKHNAVSGNKTSTILFSGRIPTPNPLQRGGANGENKRSIAVPTGTQNMVTLQPTIPEVSAGSLACELPSIHG